MSIASIRRAFSLVAMILLLALDASASVSPASVAHAATLCVNQGGTGGCYSTISAAISAVSPGDTITIAGDPSP